MAFKRNEETGQSELGMHIRVPPRALVTRHSNGAALSSGVGMLYERFAFFANLDASVCRANNFGGL